MIFRIITLFSITKLMKERALRKKFMQQNFFCSPNKTFCSFNQNLIDIAKYFVVTEK